MAAAWEPTLLHADAFRILDYKLRNVARALKSWSARHIGSVRVQLALAREITLRPDCAQENRQLTTEEAVLRKDMKFTCLGLASLARSLGVGPSLGNAPGWRTWRRATPTPDFFHLQACRRARKSHIMSLRVHDTELVRNEDMATAVFEHFNNIMGTPFQRVGSIDLETIRLQTHDLTMLDGCFSEFEI